VHPVHPLATPTVATFDGRPLCGLAEQRSRKMHISKTYKTLRLRQTANNVTQLSQQNGNSSYSGCISSDEQFPVETSLLSLPSLFVFLFKRKCPQQDTMNMNAM